MRIAELIDRGDTVELVAAINQNFCVTSKSRRIARYCNNNRDRAFGKLACLRHGALARWVEHKGVECLQFARYVWTPEEVAHMRINGLKPGCAPCRTLQRLYGSCIAIRSGDARALGET